MRTEVTFFNDTSSSYLAEYERETPEGYSFRVRREKVFELLPSGANKHLLDLASGPGIMIKGLRERGYRVMCVDAAPEMIELAKKIAPGDVDVACEVGDAYSLRFADASFEVVTAMGLIEYLDDEHRYLAETNRIVAPEGIAIITVPNVWSPWRIWNRFLRMLIKIIKPHKQTKLLHREYTRTRMRDLLVQHGFEIEMVYYYNFKIIPYPFDRIFPRATVRFSALCEKLDNTPLRFLGTGFIVKAKKKRLQQG